MHTHMQVSFPHTCDSACYVFVAVLLWSLHTHARLLTGAPEANWASVISGWSRPQRGPPPGKGRNPQGCLSTFFTGRLVRLRLSPMNCVIKSKQTLSWSRAYLLLWPKERIPCLLLTFTGGTDSSCTQQISTLLLKKMLSYKISCKFSGFFFFCNPLTQSFIMVETVPLSP